MPETGPTPSTPPATAPPAAPSAGVREPVSLVAAFRLPLDALGVLRRERSLWPLAALPVLLSLVAFGVAVGTVVVYAAELYTWATSWMPVLDAQRWYEWLWVGPVRGLLAALGAILFLAIAGGCLVVAYLLASIVASPIHDVLSARAEQILTGGLVDASVPGWRGVLREGGRAVREELRRTLFFLSLTVPLFLVGFLVPGAQLVTGPALLVITVFFLPLDYSSYTLDRRRVSFAAKRRWAMAHRPAMVGFGGAAFLTFSVPGLNFLAMPILVVAGTLLVLRLGAPAGDGPPTAPPGGSSTSP